MIYLNDESKQPLTYNQACEVALQLGVEQQRVYIFLAGLGIKSAKARQLVAGNYSEPFKVAVKDGQVLSDLKIKTTIKALK